MKCNAYKVVLYGADHELYGLRDYLEMVEHAAGKAGLSIEKVEKVHIDDWTDEHPFNSQYRAAWFDSQAYEVIDPRGFL